jgi:hypothetical protein
LEWIFVVTGIIIPLLLYRSIGRSLYSLIQKCLIRIRLVTEVSSSNDILLNKDIEVVFYMCGGLLLHLLLSWGGLFVGFSLSSSYWVSLLVLGVCSRKEIKKDVVYFKKASLKEYTPSLSYLAFFTCIITIGISLFDADTHIRTLWINNYADAMFHFGMIANMSFGNGPLTEYHLYPGEKISYPFLINFWTALLWACNPTLKTLSFLFMVQWVVIWTGVFFLLRKGMYGILPWVMFFAGGTLPVFFSQIGFSIPNLSGELSHKYISKGYPFSVFMSTIWTTQRTSLLGLLVGLSVLSLVFELLGHWRKLNKDIVLPHVCMGALILAAGLLAHFHIVGIIAAYIGMVFLLKAIKVFLFRATKEKEYFKPLVLYGVCIVFFSIPSLYLYSSKSGMLDVVYGWMIDQNMYTHIKWFIEFYGISSTHWFFTLIAMWLLNAGIWLIIIPAIFSSVSLAFSFPVMLLFLTANFIQFSVWNWDTIKVFVGIFVILVALLRHFGTSSWFLFICLLIAITPSLYESMNILGTSEYFMMYHEDDVKKAESIREETPADAIIAGNPVHTSVITLAGRKIFIGYDGWLDSHHISYSKRSALNKDLSMLLTECRSSYEHTARENCPSYLYEDPDRNTIWGLSSLIPEAIKKLGIAPTGVEGLFKIVPEDLQ